MASGGNNQLAFAIRAVNEAQKALKEAQGGIKDLGDTAEKNNGKLAKIGEALAGIGGGAMGAAQDLGKAVGIISVATGAAAIGAAGALYKLGSDFDEAFDTIAIGTGATGEDLAALENDFKKTFSAVPASMNDAALAVADWNTKVGASGPVLQDLSKTALEMSRITGSDLAMNIDSVSQLMNNWNLTVAEGSGVMDKLFIASQSTGVGIEQLARGVTDFGPALREMGFGLDESIALLGSMERSGLDGNQMFRGLQKAVVEFAKDGKDARTGITELFNDIKNAKDPTAATAKAVEIFGSRVGVNLADAIRSGKFNVEDLTAALGDSQGAIMDNADRTADLAERWTLFKNRALTALQPVASATFDFANNAIALVLDKLEEWGPAIQETFAVVLSFVTTQLIPPLQMVTSEAERFGRVLVEKVRGPIEGLAAFFQGNEQAMKALGAAVGGVLVVAFLALAVAAGAAAVSMIIAAAPVIALVAVVAALSAGIYLLIQNWDSVVEKVPALGAAFDAVKALGQQLAAWFTGSLMPALVALSSAFAAMGTAIVGFVQKHWTEISAIIGGALTIIIGLITGWVTGITAIVSGGLKIITGIINVFTGILTGDWDKAWQGIQQIVSGAWEIIKGIVSGALIALQAVVSGGLEIVKGLFTLAWDVIKNAAGEAKDFVIARFDELVEWMKGVPGKIVAAIGDVGGLLLNVGKDLIQGFVDGMKSIDIPNPLDMVPGGGIVKGAISKVPGFAEGVRNFRGGLALVGERGPELALLPRGSDVLTASQTRTVLSAGGGNSYTFSPNIVIHGSSDTKAEIIDALDTWWERTKEHEFGVGALQHGVRGV